MKHIERKRLHLLFSLFIGTGASSVSHEFGPQTPAYPVEIYGHSNNKGTNEW